jgi:Chalcone isomerase-like
MRFVKSFLLALVCLLASHAHSATVEVNGIKFEDALEVRGNKLILNGAGTRYRAIIKVYAAGLYLSKKAETPEEVIAMPGPKRMTITMLREIDSSELGRLFTRSVEDNVSRADFSKVVGGLVRMGQMFSEQKKMSAGDTFSIDWVPGTGSVITVKGQVQGEPYKEPEFFAAMMSIWLGKSPADRNLKEALLGKKPALINQNGN